MMQEIPNSHWAEDEDLLTDFIRQRLSDESRRTCEHHLASCQHCRQLVESEQNIVSGICVHARNELKQRIRINVGKHRSQSLPIPRILAAAAMIGVIAILGIVNNWFTRQPISKDLEEISLASTDETTNTTEIPYSEPAQLVPREKEEPGRQEMGMSERSTADPLRKDASKKLSEFHASEESRPAGEMHASPPPASGFAAEETPQTRDSYSVIVQGTIHYNASQALQSEEAKPRTMVAPKATKIGQPDLVGKQGHLPVVLLQAPTTQVTPEEEHIITAELRPSETGLQVVLYLDRSISDEEFGLAEVSWFNDDSLIVTLPFLQMGLRIPSEILTRQQALTPMHTGR